MRLHVGSGTIYLRDYLNVDLPSAFLSKDRPDLVEKYITTENQYYSRHTDKTVETLRQGPTVKETVCDAYGSFEFLPARNDSVDEILARQVFEHLDIGKAKLALDEAYRVMVDGGVIRLDVPDPEESLDKYVETRDPLYVRHLFGPRLDEFGFHTHYTRRLLIGLAHDAGFSFDGEESNIHPYPAFCLRFSCLKSS